MLTAAAATEPPLPPWGMVVLMGGGDWHKLNGLYTNEEYVDAQRTELRRFGGRMDRREYLVFGIVAAFVLFFVSSVAWRLLT